MEGRGLGLMIFISIYLTANCVVIRWQQYSTHLHTNSTQNDIINLGRVRAVHCLWELYRDIWLTTEEKARKNLSQKGKPPLRTEKRQSARKKS